MKTTSGEICFPRRVNFVLPRALCVAGFLMAAGGAHAQASWPTNGLLETWSFQDSTGWTSDHGHAPSAFNNLNSSNLGNGASLVVDSNLTAWLQYNVVETNGTTNFAADAGTVMFWFAPSWSSTNAGGIGPGGFARLFEAGGYMPDASVGWWSLYTDDTGNNLFFSAQPNDYSSNTVTYLSAPISWTTNFFHHIALAYSPTNTALYLDGALVTNGAGLTVYPSALTNGFFVGSDATGNLQAHGLFNSLATYSLPLDANTISLIFQRQYMFYLMSPWNTAMSSSQSANAQGATLSQPNFSANYFNIVAGAGYLQYQGAGGSCFTSSNVWLTNVATTVASQPLTFNFDIAGGYPGAWYDLFAIPALGSGLTNSGWIWMGEGVTCSRYAVPNLPTSGNLFFILGTPQDSDGDGLTDAYERLVSHSDPNKMDTDLNGMPDGWQVLHFNQTGNNPLGDPDQDGLLNLKEYLYGTDPNVSEGFGIWISSVSAACSIP
jgi:hypothetical protein